MQLAGCCRRHHRIRLGSLLVSCLSCCCFAIANVCGPAVFAIQMVYFDMVIWHNASHRGWAGFFITMEAALITHMILQSGARTVTQSGSLQWIIYSWLIAAKSGVLYFDVLPQLPTVSADQVHTMRTIISMMCLSPVYYCIVTFRTLRQVFRSAEQGQRKKAFSWGDHGALDVLLLQDMVWHVVIDLVDITSMLFLTRLTDESLGERLGKEFPDQTRAMTVTAGVFVILALFFHQQSFPSISFATSAELPETTKHATEDTPQTSLDMSTTSSFLTATDSASGSGVGVGIGGRTASRHSLGSGPEVAGGTPPDSPSRGNGSAKTKSVQYGVDVVKARKRSAVVSILLVDLPFCGIRTAQYVLSVQTAELPSPQNPGRGPLAQPTIASPNVAVDLGTLDGNATGAQTWTWTSGLAGALPLGADSNKPRLDKWWIKNVLCLFLQAMQLRFVQQADLEKSQNLQWLDVHRSETSASKTVARRRRRDERQLTRVWEDIEREKRRERDLELAVQQPSFSSDERPQEEERHLLEDNQRNLAVPVVGASAASSSSVAAAAGRGHGAKKGGAKGHVDSDSDEEDLDARGSCLLVRCFLDCCCCCLRRRRRERCAGWKSWLLSRRRLPGGGYVYRCCRLDCTPSWFHAIMGFVLGWLLAKTDFTQIFNDSAVALGAETAWQTSKTL
eukprot:TRINITY_DN5278_c0_g5_i1.p1 TRINITY_DN5278_c0_g5~~TRINITY_DN5278_c0_g5_i1.p1  ORF type:complete len:676 (-),score=110.01 TRINITY_DN5278_c0_g5_i1:45-2072(-)